MSIKQKFESIDQSQLSENQKEILGKIKTATKDFTITDEKALEKVDSALDNIITKLKATNPQAIKVEAKKREPRAKKEVVKKEPKSETKKPKKDKKESSGKRTIFSIAKEIRKADESWEDAKARAKKVMETEKKDTTKKMKTETDKLLAFIKRRKELEGLSGTSIKKDSKIEALPKGRRISKKGWKNQHGESQGGKVYYENRDNRTDRLAPNFADKIYLADGGGVDGNEVIKLKVYGLSGKVIREGDFLINYNDSKITFPSGKTFKVVEDREYTIKIQKTQIKAIRGIKGLSDFLKELNTPDTPFGSMANKLIDLGKDGKYADGGTIIGTPETPLGRDLGISYTGLVGETGAMSSGEMFAYGGKTKSRPSMREFYIEQIAFSTNTRKEGVDAFAKDNNLTDAELSNLMTGIGRKMISQSDFVTALVGNKNNTKQKEVVAFAKSDKAYKMAYGGGVGAKTFYSLDQIEYTVEYSDKHGKTYNETFKTKDEALNEIYKLKKLGYNIISKTRHFKDDGSFNGYFADGGSIIGTPETPLGRDLGISYTGLVGETGAMSSGEMFMNGGSTGLPAGAEQQFVNYYLNEGASVGIFEQGGSLVDGYLTDPNFGDFQAGVYAEGGSLGNHGLKQGDQIVKTMSGGVQKVKTKSGDIVYVNLANGYRGAEPPLPFKNGGAVKKNLSRDRKLVNYSQDYEVRYSKDKPSRSGYTKPKMSRTQFEDESFEFFVDGGKIDKIKLGTPVSYKNDIWEVSQKNGIVGITNMKQGAWGSDFPFIPISKINIETELKDFYGKPIKRNQIPYLVEDFADGGLIGKEVTFMSQGEKNRGIIGEVNEDGSLAVDTGRSLRLVEKDEIVEIHDKPKKRGFFFDNGGTIDAFQMRTVKGIDNNPTEILTDEQKVQFATGGGVDLNYDGYVPTYRITEIHTKDGKVFENVYSDSEVLSGIYYSDKPLRSKEPKNKNQMELFKKGGLPKTSFYIPRYNIDFIETEHVGKIQGNHIYGGVWIDMKKQFRLVEEAKKQGRFVNKPKFEVDELVYNKTTNSVGIVRIAEEKGEVKTDADGNVSVAELELYNPLKFKHQSKAKVAPSTLKEIDNRGLYKPYSYAGGGKIQQIKRDLNELEKLFHVEEKNFYYGNNVS
jgi:hypothetical protein